MSVYNNDRERCYSEPVRQHTETYTYADLLTWPEDERWELIDGVPYDMSPAPSRRHQDISTALIVAIGKFLSGSQCRLYHAPFDVRLPKPQEDALTSTTVVQPDLVVVCERKQLDKRGCVGGPTLIVEIISPGTLTKDMNQKLRAYERAGVPEYWVVWPETNTVMVFLLDEQGRYHAPTVYEQTDHVPVGVLPGLVIDLGVVFVE